MGDSVIATLREVLLAYFSEAELVGLCRDFDIDYGDLPGVGPLAKTRAMIAILRDRNKLDQLMARIHDLRPEAYLVSGLAKMVVHQRLVTRIADTTNRINKRAQTRKNVIRGSVSFAVILFAVMGLLTVFNTFRPNDAQPSAEPAIAQAAATAPASPGKILITVAPQNLTSDKDLEQQGTHTGPPIVITVPKLNEAIALKLPPIFSAESENATDAIAKISKLQSDVLAGVLNNENIGGWAAQAKADYDDFNKSLVPAIGSGKIISMRLTVKSLQTPVFASSDDEIVVKSKEQWEYAAGSNALSGCQQREFVYTLIRQPDGSLSVKKFSGLILSRICP